MAKITNSKTVNVDVDLDDFSDDEIYDEYHERDLWEREKKEDPDFSVLTDQMKYDFFMDNFNKITLEQLESLIK